MTAARDPVDEPLIGGVELGGTKAVVLIARGSEIVERRRIPTTDPETTLTAVAEQLVVWNAAEPVAAIGVGSFGPVGLDRRRGDYGHVTSTPKPGWAGADVLGHLADRFDVPLGFDTDVAAAALAEGRWGAARGCAVHVYITIGTGIGGGLVVASRPVHGLVHPEHGHLRVRRRPGDDFAGVCPYHGDCIEGLASGPAIAARAGAPADQLGHDHPVWRDVAAELGELFALLVLAASPERIVVGGGVGTGQRCLLPAVHRSLLAALGGYVAPHDERAAAELVVAAELGDEAGPLGAVALGLDALTDAGA